jgi:hypothetical protein
MMIAIKSEMFQLRMQQHEKINKKQKTKNKKCHSLLKLQMMIKLPIIA